MAAAGAVPWPQSTKVSPRPAWWAMTGTSPPGPFRCGSTTWSTSPAATAASNALPPCSSTAIPAAEASQCVEATMPNVPASSGLVVNPGMSAMTRSSHLAPSRAGPVCRLAPCWTPPRCRSVPARESRARRPDNVSAHGPFPAGARRLRPRRVRGTRVRGPARVRRQAAGPVARGVRAGLARLEEARAGSGPLPDPHDEAHLSAAEELKRVTFARLELHRRNPLFHLGELDLSCYDRDYAPQQERDAARAAHLAAWPQAADAAVESLDQVSAPVAEALLGGIRGLAAGLTAGTSGGPGEETLAAARAAHARLVAHVERAAAQGDPDPALGGPALAALMGGAEALPVDLGRLAEQADAERDRLHALLADWCARIDARAGPRSRWPANWSGITRTGTA